MSVLCVGEILWDVLPKGTFLGGAPLNVAAHLARLGQESALLSAVGDDDPGRRARRGAEALGVNVRLLQTHRSLPTGTAHAVLDASGGAEFVIDEPVAFDALACSAEAELAAQTADALVFGTLAQRQSASRETIGKLIKLARWRVFDPNLRAPHVDPDQVMKLAAQCDLLKVNEDEGAFFGRLLACPGTPEALYQALRARYGLEMLCVTRGANGAVLLTAEERFEQPGIPVQVTDTVGAGDAFLAALIAEKLNRRLTAESLRRAAGLAAYVATQPGAVPDYRGADFFPGK
jgi:fructokinase